MGMELTRLGGSTVLEDSELASRRSRSAEPLQDRLLIHRKRVLRGAGFTLIEGLISAAILLAIAVGLMPLFTRAMINNQAGADFTQITNAARDRLEEFSQLPFTSEQLTLQAGTERTYDEYFSQADKIWKDGTEADASAAGDQVLVTRVTTVRQFNVNDLETPLDSIAPPGSVQLKEITVVASLTRLGGPFGPGKQHTARLLKSR